MEGELLGRIRSLSAVCIMVAAMFFGFAITFHEPADGLIRYVGPDSTYKNLQDALDNATSGDIIAIEEGTYNGSFRSVKNGLMIRGNSTENTTLILDGTDPAVLSGDWNDISGLTIENGSLRIYGNGPDISEVHVMTQDSSMVLENSTGGQIDGMVIGKDVKKGLVIRNCTSTTVNDLSGDNITKTAISIVNSNMTSVVSTRISMNGTGPAIDVEGSTGTIIDSFVIWSNGTGNMAVSVSDSDKIQFRNGTLEIAGKSLDLTGSTDIVIQNVSVAMKGDGSKGIEADLCNDLLINKTEVLLMDSSVFMDIRNTGNSSIEYSTIQISDDGIGIKGVSSGPIRIMESEITMVGNDSTGVHLDETDSVILWDLDLTSKGGHSVAILLDNCSSVDLMESSIDALGDGSRGLMQRGICSDLSMDGSKVTIRGSDVIGIHLMDVSDSIIVDTPFKVQGVSSIGLHATGDNLTLTGNSYTALEEDSKGAILSGTDIRLVNDSAYAMGRASLGIGSVLLDGLRMKDTKIDVTGKDAKGLESLGVSGNYTIRDCELDGDEDTDILIDLDDGDSDLMLINSTLTSTGTKSVLRARVDSAYLSDVSISTAGEGIHFLDTDKLSMTSCYIDSSLPFRIFNGNASISDCDLGTSPQSLEVLDGSHVELVDTPNNGVILDPSSRIESFFTIGIRTTDRFDVPVSGVDLQILSSGEEIYGTEHFNSTSSDPLTDTDGMAGPFLLKNILFEGSPDPVQINNTINIFKKGSSHEDWSESYLMDTSGKHTLTFVSPDIDRPSVVSDLTVIPLDTREELRVSWTPNEDDTLVYRLFRLDMDDLSTWHQVAEVDHPMATWTTDGLGPGDVGIFRIVAWDGTWESAPSSLATGVTKDLTPPEVPRDLSLLLAGESIITITWDHPGSDDLAGFDIFLNKTDSFEMEKIESVSGENRSYTFRGLSWGTLYNIQINAVDSSGNPSNLTPVLEVSTALIQVSVQVKAYYHDGPFSGRPVFNGTVTLFSFNGTVAATGISDSTGTILFTGLIPDEIYRVEISPPSDMKGERDARSGYLPNGSDTFQMNEEDRSRTLNLTLQYYEMPVSGSIRIAVSYGEGPRDGPAYQAHVVLLNDNEEVVETGQTDADGEIFFTIPKIPFRGRFEVTPAQGIAGDMDTNRSGYLAQTTNFFEITASRPDFGEFDVELVYFDFIAPPDDLMIVSFMPKGENISLDENIIIRFSMPVNTDSVEANVKVVPALSGLKYRWDNSSMNLTIEHDDLLPEKDYTVTVEFGAFSLEGTSFPDDYKDNSWTFQTEKEDSGASGGNSDQIMMIIVVGLIVLVLIVGIYLYSTRRKMDEELDEDDVYALSDEEYYDEEDEYYEDGEDDYLDEEFGDIPEDEEMEGFEDEEYPEEGPEEESPVEDEEAPPEEEEGPTEEPDDEELAPPEEEPVEEEEGPSEETSEDPEEEEMMEEEAPEEKPRRKKKRKKRRK